MNRAQCHICSQFFEVPTAHAMQYVMVHQIPCTDCFNNYHYFVKYEN